MDMIRNDLQFMLPDDNGRRVCEMALASFSDATVRLTEQFEGVLVTMPEQPQPAATESPSSKEQEGREQGGVKVARRCRKAAVEFANTVPEAARAKVLELAGALTACSDNVEDLPPFLDLSGPANEDQSALTRPPPPAAPLTEPTPIDDGSGSGASPLSSSSIRKLPPLDKNDRANVQFRDHWCWEVEDNAPDPGQTVTLRKYDPIDVLQLPERARNLAEAVDAIRLCDRQCIKMTNQGHCIKNHSHLIASLIEHVFVQVGSE